MTLPFQIGLNPYGLTYTLGLQGAGTARANSAGTGLAGFVRLAREIGAHVIELDHRWLTPLDVPALARLREDLTGMVPVCSFWLSHTPGETLADAVRCATALGASLVRLHLTPVLAGGRAACGDAWPVMVRHASETLLRESPRVADAGLHLGLEDHQDLGSEELLALADAAGPHVGIVFDTGNPFAVGEDPVAFARRVAPRLRHVHLKDYRAQFTDEGVRLVRCAIGDGCVPFEEIAAVLQGRPAPVTASLEPGALDARHVRLFTRAWWHGYRPRDAGELGEALGRLRLRRLADDADARTPWERHAPGADITAYELDQLQRSVAFVRRLGWF